MADNPLNDKQLEFCRQYIIDFNQTQAAIRAGYSAKSAAATSSRLLTNVNIQEEIRRLQGERNERTGVNADFVVDKLHDIVTMDIRDFVEWGIEKRPKLYKNGRQKRDKAGNLEYDEIHYVRPVDMSKVDGTLIQSVKMGKYGFQIELIDRARALEMLAKHTGVFDDRPQTTVDIAPYAEAVKKAVENANIWDGFDNGGPAPDDGEGDG